jgi:hypothetical protein
MKKTTKKSKDLPAKGTVKGGGIISTNENLTLVRAAKPTPKPKKDLPARITVKGGGLSSVNDNLTLVRAAKPRPTKARTDLSPKSGSVKGGSTKLAANDNLTLVRRRA